MSDEPPFEYRKWVHEMDRRAAERIHDRQDALVDRLNEATVTSGQAALRAALVVNGGAAAAMLAFIGSLAAVVDRPDLAAIAASLIWFAWGVAAAVSGMALAYFANGFAGASLNSHDKAWEHPYLREGGLTKRWRRGTILFQTLTVIAAAISLGLFIAGMLDVEASIGLLNHAER